MKYSRAIILWGSVIGMGVICLGWWCDARLNDARDAAVNAAVDTAQCDDLARQIEAMAAQNEPADRGSPRNFTIAAAQNSAGENLPMGSAADISADIASALKGAGIPAQQLLRVTHESTRRLPGTNYEQFPTHIVLDQVLLGQTIDFLTAIASGKSGATVQAIRLTGPPDPNNPAWTAEITLSQRVYNPAKDRTTGIP